jgi:predicted RNA-binding protein with PIN domain
MTPRARAGRRWLVDGMNVIGSRPDGWWRDRTGAMRRLTAGLETLARETGEPVTVIFDGAPREIGSDRIEVRFARRRGQNAADDDIAALAAADDDPASLRVVTSDSGLAARVRPAGVELVGAGEFRRRLDALAAADGEEPAAGGRSSEP